jgi:predicted phosphodiesterase
MSVKIFFSSDLHLEYEDPEIDSSPFYIYSKPEMVDVYAKSYLVLAGDICQIFEKEKFRAFFDIITKKFKAIIYVTGNHEYHRIVYGDILINQGIYRYSNVYFLQNDFIEFPEDGIRFYGTTLWSQLDPNLENNKIAEKAGSDFKSIYNHDPLEMSKSRYITRNGTAKLFEKQFENLKFDLTSSNKLKTIVVTHHTPLIEIIQPWIKKNEKTHTPVAYLYASDLKSELEKLDFDYWIFGHSHTTYHHELKLKNNKMAKFMSNPYGYFGSNNKFSPDEYIEI